MELQNHQFEPERSVHLRDGTRVECILTKMPDGRMSGSLSRSLGGDVLTGCSFPATDAGAAIAHADELFAQMCGEDLARLGIDLSKARTQRPDTAPTATGRCKPQLIAAAVLAAAATILGSIDAATSASSDERPEKIINSSK